MSTPTDPYNSGSRRPFDDDSILAPIEDDTDGAATDDQAAWDRAFNSDEEFDPADFESRDDEPTEVPEDATENVVREDKALEDDATREYDIERDVEGDVAATDEGEMVGESTDRGDEPTDRDWDGADHRAPDMFRDEDTRDKNPTLGGYVAERHGTNGERNDLDAFAQDDGEFGDGDSVDGVDESRNGPTRTSVMGAAKPAVVVTPSAPSPDETPDMQAFTAAAAPVTDEDRERWAADPGDDALAEDIPEEPKGRGLAHFGTLLLTLLLVPVAWYLISDAGARLAAVPNNPWDTGTVQILPLLELLGGFVVLAVIWLRARVSSLGAQVIGAIVALAGLAALVVPKLGNDVVTMLGDAIGGYNDFTGNVVFHLGNDLGSGRIAAFGIILFMTGLAAHGARRRGHQIATAVTRRHFLLDDSAKTD